VSRAPINIGLVLSGAARDAVAAALMRAGYEVHIAASDTRVRAMVAREAVEGWIFDARSEDVLDLLLTTGNFLLPADNIPDPDDRRVFSRWVRGLIEQLDAAFSNVHTGTGAGKIDRWNEVRGVWLLAGSAGATSAVQTFLNTFTEPPPVAFIYAQHLDPGQHHQLYHFTLQNKRFSLLMAAGVQALEPAQLVMISPRFKVTVNRFGQLSATRRQWSGEHTPDINELLVILSAARLPSCGVIVFSGMGDDGADALRVFTAGGGRVWAQSPESAISPAMPRAAINTGLVQRTGDPATLAAHLACLYPPD
jgi:chemosensory pili system protein ChpB (putative protein-glutamate methylesterase)